MTKKQGIIYVPRTEAKFVIPEVVCRGKTPTYELSEEMSPPMNMKQLGRYNGEQRKVGNPYPASADEVRAIMSVVANRKGSQAEKVRDFIRKNIWANTATVVGYAPLGEIDEVIRDYGAPDQFSLRESIVGPDRFIESADSGLSEAILGEGNINVINSIAQKMYGTNFYIWRLNSKPLFQKTKGVVRFGANSGRRGLGCDGDPRGKCPAFRVLREE